MFPLTPLRMPGATLATRLKVYDTVAPDGQVGGTPHMHLCCTEMYFVTAGSGTVEMIDRSGFSSIELPLYGAYIFSPGTIHRLINPNKDMELFIIMQNSGLPERGDNVVTFTGSIMESDDQYQAAMKVHNLEDGYRRRDQGVNGFTELKAAFLRDSQEGSAALKCFYQQAGRRTEGRHGEWRQVINAGALAEANQSMESLDALDAGNVDYLMNAQQHLILPKPYSAVGFCGQLNRYFDPATLSLEGRISTQ